MSEVRKTAVVTGGSRGIGRATVNKLASMGYNIAFCYTSDEAGADATVADCKALGVECIKIKANIADSNDCKMIIDTAKDTFGSVDVLVNNAGITRDNLIIRISDEDMDKVIDVNLKGCFYMMREASRVMIKQKSGKIINLSSVVGIMGNAGQVNYSASKAGVIGMTKSLARELAARNINVNAVAPGFIKTDMTDVLSDSVKEGIAASIPFKRMGEASDVANVIGFLASDAGNYITGQVISVDGGMSI